ncbi:MAG: ABC transporter ATP-binding protein, partial [Lachnospiraceae bacterium]|nr:ABC transporter ATP-binding protein [Lachnospiraceae bacterium]
MISVTNLTKKFDEFTALDSVDIEIKEGVIYGVVGSNGAGKSTLLRLMSGVYQPDNGEILIDDKKVWENPEVKENIAYIPDDLYLQNGANMDSMARLHGAIYNNFDKKRFNELAEIFKLDTKKSLNTFSKGMKRQVVIILALSRNPKYMFFDETFDGLD